jgi:hypothetical protein
VSGARIPEPVGAIVIVTLQHVGADCQRIKCMFVVEFVSADKTRDTLIRKLFSGRYAQRCGVVDWVGLVGALFARIFR